MRARRFCRTANWQLRAGVLEEAAEVERLGGEIVPHLELDAVDLEADAGLGEDPVVALEIAVLDGVDLHRVGGEIPGRRRAGVEAGLDHRLERGLSAGPELV